ncbi:MAG: ABC transporter permease subunit, partial [Pseudomonadota bacterium]
MTATSTEAARLDGANHLQVLRHVILPLSVPVLAT